MLTINEPFAAGQSETCSVTAQFHSKIGKPAGMTEAEWEMHRLKGEVGVLFGKAKAGTLADADLYIIPAGKPNAGIKIFSRNGSLFYQEPGGKASKYYEIDSDIMANEISFKGMKRVGKPPPAVHAGSESVGKMTDEDMSVLYVKSKDDLAKVKGLNVQGANPMLDSEVFQALADITGYTKQEVIDKIAAYKASGKKLSSLKKQVLKSDKKYADALAKAKGGKPSPPKISEPDVKMPPSPVVTKVEPKVVPTVATPEVKEQVVQQAAHTLAKNAPSQEDLVKAYIKAKDKLAADPTNGFNLYSKGIDFDNAMEKLIKDFGMDVKISDVNKAVADYVASGKKVSGLKKSMIKNGEMDADAPTLKKTKPPEEKIMEKPPTNSVVEAKSQIDEAVKVADQYSAEQIAKLYDQKGLAELLFSKLNGQIAAYKTDYVNMAQFYAEAKKYKMSLSSVIKIYDQAKAKSLKVENSNFYEKKIMEFLSTPAGKKKALDLENGGYNPPSPTYTPKPAPESKIVGQLAEDAGKFAQISPEEAVRMQSSLDPWTGVQKAALKKYTGSSYTSINGQLRRGEPGRGSYDVDQSQTIKQMDAGMRPMPKDLIVHRGTNLSQFGVNNETELFEMVGKKIKDKGYLSTSVGGRAAFSRNVIMEIEVPKGSRAAYVDHISSHKGEKELILARGTQMQIVRIEQDGYKTIVRVRVVDQDG